MTSDSDHASKIIYQFSRWAKPFADLPLHADADGMARLLAAAAISSKDRVLDVACGPGIVACRAAAMAMSVVGIDMTPAMIAQARERQRAFGLDNIVWDIGDATQLPYPGAAFEVVLTRYSFHHLRDPRAVLAEMRRVCRPGGRVIVIDATPTPETCDAYDRMEILRDPSHVHALTLSELRNLGRDLILSEISIDHYKLEAVLETLADPDDMPALSAMFEDDIVGGEDRMGVGARRTADGLCFDFPVSIVAWSRPLDEGRPL